MTGIAVVTCQWLISTCSCAEQQADHGEAEESEDQPLSERAEGSDPGRDEEGCKSHQCNILYASHSISSTQDSSKAVLKIHHIRQIPA